MTAPLADVAWVAAHHRDPDVRVVDCGRREAYRPGEQRGGRVPGAVHLHWSRLLAGDGSGRLRPPDEIRGLLREEGIDPALETVTYCQAAVWR